MDLPNLFLAQFIFSGLRLTADLLPASDPASNPLVPALATVPIGNGFGWTMV